MILTTKGKIGPLSQNRGKDEYVWNIGDTLECLLVLSYSLIRVNGKLNNPVQTGLLITDPSGINVWVTWPNKEPQSAEVLAECKENPEWIEDEGNYKYQLYSDGQ